MQNPDPSFAALVAREPWRQRIGHPNTVDDPLFIPEDHVECDGDVLYEGGTNYWHCTKCGYVGWATVTKHYEVLSPRRYYSWCQNYYEMTREQESPELTRKEIVDQTLFLMGLVLKVAATKKPHELKEFAEKLAQL